MNKRWIKLVSICIIQGSFFATEAIGAMSCERAPNRPDLSRPVCCLSKAHWVQLMHSIVIFHTSSHDFSFDIWSWNIITTHHFFLYLITHPLHFKLRFVHEILVRRNKCHLQMHDYPLQIFKLNNLVEIYKKGFLFVSKIYSLLLSLYCLILWLPFQQSPLLNSFILHLAGYHRIESQHWDNTITLFLHNVSRLIV